MSGLALTRLFGKEGLTYYFYRQNAIKNIMQIRNAGNENYKSNRGLERCL
jgi:hypothetical protein